ncbi:MAG: hypothetical protein ACRD38_04935 [Nitrososphaerales archaeon]
MLGFCSRCKEYRSEDDAWGIVFSNGFPRCEKCGSYVDMLED